MKWRIVLDIVRSAAVGMTRRRGAGNFKHIIVHEWWLRGVTGTETRSERPGRAVLRKVGRDGHPVDWLTKHVSD